MITFQPLAVFARKSKTAILNLDPAGLPLPVAVQLPPLDPAYPVAEIAAADIVAAVVADIAVVFAVAVVEIVAVVVAVASVRVAVVDFCKSPAILQAYLNAFP